jgi:subtilisin family serine protease
MPPRRTAHPWRAPLLAAALPALLVACARGTTLAPVARPAIVVEPAAPAPERAGGAEGADAAVMRATARADWHRLDLDADGVLGAGSERALRELLADRAPKRRVVVAVIDGGVDTAHVRLAPNLWRNPREVAGNGVDDDGNGYVDDVFGWNFIGGPDGRSVHHDTFEVTRLYAACRGLPAGEGLARPDGATCDAVAAAYARKRAEVGGMLAQISGISSALEQTTAALRRALATDTLTTARVSAFQPATPQLQQARRLWLQLDANGLDSAELAGARTAYDGQFRYGLDTMFTPRAIVEGAPLPAGRRPGNADVTGPDAAHGTHVAGIIGARRDADGPLADVRGIAPSVALMALRAVPDGDERDEDVAAAIRYAADHGAHIVNLSFGKGWSPRKAVVDSAVRHAEAKGVLLVHAAGNDAEDVDNVPSFPSPVYADGTRARAWLEVGASSWKGLDQLAAPFSNFGRQRVDLFAPGVDILSAAPGGAQVRESGTSMAAPVVSGVAALLMAYFPELTAGEVRDLLVASARPFRDRMVERPGSGEPVPFDRLSRTGGVVDAFAAVKLALQRQQVRPELRP